MHSSGPLIEYNLGRATEDLCKHSGREQKSTTSGCSYFVLLSPRLLFLLNDRN